MNGQPQQQPIRQAGQEEGLPFGWCEFKLQERLDILRQQGFKSAAVQFANAEVATQPGSQLSPDTGRNKKVTRALPQEARHHPFDSGGAPSNTQMSAVASPASCAPAHRRRSAARSSSSVG